MVAPQVEHDAGDAEVHELGGAVPGVADVARLDVAVQDVRGVEVLEGLGHGDAELDGLVGLEPPLLDALGERAPLEQLHHQHRRPLPGLHAVDRGEVGVGDRRRRARLAPQPHGVLGRDPAQGLDRHRPAQREVDAAIDDAHAAGADPPLEAELAGQHVGEVRRLQPPAARGCRRRCRRGTGGRSWGTPWRARRWRRRSLAGAGGRLPLPPPPASSVARSRASGSAPAPAPRRRCWRWRAGAAGPP